jgi:hypothetical protein
MPITYPLQEIVAHDRLLKAAQAGDSFAQDSAELSALYHGQLRELHKAFERQVRLGDPENRRTFAPALASRLARRAAVLYSQPPTRRLRGSPDDDGRIDDLAERMLLDAAYDQVDALRQLQRQVFVAFAGSDAHGGVVVRAYEPTRVARKPTAGHYDLIDEDEAVAICVRPRARWGEDLSAELWELWLHEDDGGWAAVRVDGLGRLVEPVFDGPRSPFGEVLPIAVCTDELLMGRAWLPIPQHRIDLILNIASIAADAGFVAKQEAHSNRVYERAPGEEEGGAPAEIGPGRTLEIPNGASYEVVGNQTQPSILTDAIDRGLAMLAISEDLPPDTFWIQRTLPSSSLSLRFVYAEAERRRLSQIRVTEMFERQALRKALRVWSTLFPGEIAIGEDEQLDVRFASAWLPTDPVEAQNVSYKDLATGLLSPLTYVQRRDGLASRAAAAAAIEEARRDLERYRLTPAPELVAEAVASFQPQSPGAVVDGPPGPGVDATKAPGALDPRVAANAEGASVTAAITG